MFYTAFSVIETICVIVVVLNILPPPPRIRNTIIKRPTLVEYIINTNITIYKKRSCTDFANCLAFFGGSNEDDGRWSQNLNTFWVSLRFAKSFVCGTQHHKGDPAMGGDLNINTFRLKFMTPSWVFFCVCEDCARSVLMILICFFWVFLSSSKEFRRHYSQWI